MGAEITPQFPVLCPLTHAPQWTHPTGGTGRRSTRGLFPEHVLQLHTIHGTSWREGTLAGLFPRAHLTVTYRTWHFEICTFNQTFLRTAATNQPTNKRTNLIRGGVYLFFLSEVITAGLRAGSHVESFLETQLSHCHSLGHFMPGLLGEGDLRAVPAWGHTVVLQSAHPGLCSWSDPVKDSTVRWSCT